jgi:TRAP-type C4-dicarboxylate transport system substrate-binding protein
MKGTAMITRRHFTSSAAVAFAAGLGMPLTARAAVNLDVSTILPDGSFHTDNAKLYAAEVLKATQGEVKINVHSGGALGFKGPDHLRAVRDGLVPMADILVSQQVGDEPLYGAESLPFLVNTPEELQVLHKYLRPDLEAAAQKHNQRILYMVPWPTQYFHLKVKSDSVAGLKGVKIRVSDKNSQDMVAALGMSPVLIPWGETIPALASGAISGVVTSSVSGVDGRLWEFVKYVYPTNHTWTCQMVNINLDAFRKLSQAQQDALLSTARRLEPLFWARTRNVDAESLKRLKEQGMEVVSIPPAMAAELRQRTAPLVEAFVKRVPASRKAIEAYMAEVRRS